MLATFKRGDTFRVLIDDFTAAEWEALYPWDQAISHARQVGASYALTVTANPDARAILISGDTTAWNLAPVFADLRILRDGVRLSIPGAEVFKALIVESPTPIPAPAPEEPA